MNTPTRDSERDATVPSDPMDSVARRDAALPEGTMVGEYEITGKLGEGGFGTVYRAVHPLIGKTAAVKVLSREFSANPEMVSRFVAEARAANTIRHANIIDVFNFGRLDDGRHYFVMELLDGASFDRFIAEKGALDPPLVVAIMRPVARALDAAHEKNIVHRDLKPDNIFLTFDDEGKPVPKLLDFGIAKLLGDAKQISGHKTRTGTPVGTPHYMAPEQCLGEDVDERVDVYAFGVVCFEALTGEPPFTGKSFLELMNKQTNAPRPRASERHPELSEVFDEPIQRMMAIARDERPAAPGEAFALLEAAASAAGFDVDAPRLLSRDDRRVRTAISQADTIASGVTAKTTAPSSQPASGPGAGERSSLGTAALLGGVLVLAVGAYVASGAVGSGAEAPAPSSAATPTVTTESVGTALPSASSSSRPAPSSAPEPSAKAAAARSFTVSVRVTPSAARGVVYLVEGDIKTKLGAPGSLELVGLAGEQRTIAVTAEGYVDAERTLVLGDDEVVELTLVKKPVPRLNKDLEDPFR